MVAKFLSLPFVCGSVGRYIQLVLQMFTTTTIGQTNQVTFEDTHSFSDA